MVNGPRTSSNLPGGSRRRYSNSSLSVYAGRDFLGSVARRRDGFEALDGGGEPLRHLSQHQGCCRRGLCCGVGVMTADTLHFQQSQQLRKQFETLAKNFKETKIEVPRDLKDKIGAVLDKHSDLRWDDAIQIVLDKKLLDHVRAKKQKAKKKSGDFTNADEDEGDAS
jgi:hypothetical protein